MDLDKEVEIAERICTKLVNVQRIEWIKWVRYLRQTNWEKALQLAHLLSETPMLRPDPRENYERIYSVMSRERVELEEIFHKYPGQLLKILGYVSWKLSIATATSGRY